VFRARPKLMQEERSIEVMTSIFQSPDENDHARLLRIMQEFLLSELSKHVDKQKGGGRHEPWFRTLNHCPGLRTGLFSKTLNMEELIGSADSLMESEYDILLT
jgi:hypothetical protein